MKWRTIEEATTKRVDGCCVTSEKMLVKGLIDDEDYRIVEANTMVNRNLMCIPVRELNAPALRESEDERTRKEIIALVRAHVTPNDTCLVRGGSTTREKAEAWLEKQKEQKPVENEKVEMAEFEQSIYDLCPVLGIEEAKATASDLLELAKKTLLKTGKVVLASNYPEGCSFEDGFHLGYNEGFNAKKEQKSVWSKEDEMYLSQAIETLEHENYLILAEKLKSLKPQPKQEWSEADEVYMENALWCVEKAEKSCKDGEDKGACWSARRWLKSLRPQPKQDGGDDYNKGYIKGRADTLKEFDDMHSWKPTEEQMEALLGAEGILRSLQYDDRAKILAQLYEQLKAIKEDKK